jgi:hypothetical protein
VGDRHSRSTRGWWGPPFLHQLTGLDLRPSPPWLREGVVPAGAVETRAGHFCTLGSFSLLIGLGGSLVLASPPLSCSALYFPAFPSKNHKEDRSVGGSQDPHPQQPPQS